MTFSQLTPPEILMKRLNIVTGSPAKYSSLAWPRRKPPGFNGENVEKKHDVDVDDVDDVDCRSLS